MSAYTEVLHEVMTDLTAVQMEIKELTEREEELERVVRYLSRKVPAAPSEAGKPYMGLSLIEASVVFLGSLRTEQWCDTRAITNALEAGGYDSKAADLYNNAFSTFTQEVKKDDPRIVKSGSRWGLPHWSRKPPAPERLSDHSSGN